eukprot:237151_1
MSSGMLSPRMSPSTTVVHNASAQTMPQNSVEVQTDPLEEEEVQDIDAVPIERSTSNDTVVRRGSSKSTKMTKVQKAIRRMNGATKFFRKNLVGKFAKQLENIAGDYIQANELCNPANFSTVQRTKCNISHTFKNLEEFILNDDEADFLKLKLSVASTMGVVTYMAEIVAMEPDTVGLALGEIKDTFNLDEETVHRWYEYISTVLKSIDTESNSTGGYNKALQLMSKTSRCNIVLALYDSGLKPAAFALLIIEMEFDSIVADEVIRVSNCKISDKFKHMKVIQNVKNDLKA